MKRPLSPSLRLFQAEPRVSPVEPFAPVEAVTPEKRRPVDLTLGDGIGELLGYNDWGEWRTVPGFNEEKLQISDKGYLRVNFTGGWTTPSKGSSRHDNRYRVGVDGFGYLVARLVCRAFHGPAPSANHEVDHIDRDRSNSAASNLRWASKKENIANQRNDKKLNSDGKPIFIRSLDWPPERKWEHFTSAGAAAKAYSMYGLHASALGNVANTRIGTQTGRAHNQHKGFVTKWAPSPETQENLKPGDDSNLLEPPLPTGDTKLVEFPEAGASTTEEEWKMAPGTDKLKISTRGRVQTKNVRGDGWGYKRTPQPTDGEVYARVKYKGKLRGVHIVVHLAFLGPVPERCTVDHKVSSRKFDNRLVNLRSATRSEQSTNQERKPRSEIHNSRKKAVWGKPIGEETWERFESGMEAMRALHTRDPTKAFDQANIGKCADGKIQTAYGWVFRWA
ncbi:MAG: hypothetical protein CMI16_07535 [Opitutaceae bacterium]|nr:hypothetical protein [Opitutaceae bacterium]